uniref:Glycerophosphodiester phosphodiesterase domain containing 2 n=1 Tax=Amphiprion percula TaxID=161767 RepID=A0A3P8SGZ8_AMPPE
WFSVVTLVSLLSLCWMYICLVTFNDQSSLFLCFVLFLPLSVPFILLTLCYWLLFCYQAGVHTAQTVGELVHGADHHFCCVNQLLCSAAGISLEWEQEWATVLLSLQATGPFLQFGAVGALTLLSSFVFQGFHRAKKGHKFLIAVVFLVVSAAIFLCPLFIRSPCLTDLDEEIPEKPKLIGHRGAPMLAPENTMMSFRRSIACNVTAFETDVQLSKDRIPFLMHDNKSEFLLRTTNVKEKFPKTKFNQSTDLTLEELQSLNAGEWFLKVRPVLLYVLVQTFKETARNQTIPSLLQLLNLAKQHNISVIFDLYSPNQENDTNFCLSQVLWLPPAQREYVNMRAPGFTQIYNNEMDMLNKTGSHLNVKYSKLSMNKIRELRMNNVTVNLWVVNERWLFSLLWCAGASSVTTNSCHLLKDVHQPDWVLVSHYPALNTITSRWASYILHFTFILRQEVQKSSRTLLPLKLLLPLSLNRQFSLNPDK